MAISIRTPGSWAAVNATTQTVTLPSHSTGDMLIVRVGMKHATLPGNITCATAGWARIGQHNSGTGASSNGGGDVQVAAFWKEAASGAETNPVITFHASTAATPGCAVAMSYQKGGSEVWATPEGAGGTIAAATSMTATMGSHIAAAAGDMLDAFTVTNDNTTLTVPTVTQSGLTLAAVTESPAAALSDATSNDIAADGCYRLVNSGTSSAAAVVTGTNSVADIGAAWVTRLRAATPTQTSVAEVSLAPASTPASQIDHALHARARVTSGTGVLKMALYEGANNRSGDLTSSALTTSLADYRLSMTDAAAASITDYTNLSVRFWGYSAAGGAIVYEVDQVWLELPEEAGIPPVTGTFASTVAGPSAAFTASEAIPGTFASTSPPPTSSWTGLVANPVTGTVASSSPTPTAAFTAAETFTGTFASVAPGPSSALTGTVANPVTGTFAGTAPSPTGAFAGSESIPGTFASTAPSPTAALTGSETIPGTLASTVAGPSSDFTGLHVQPVTGTFASTAPFPTSDFAGGQVEPVTGTLAGTLPTPSSSFAGLETITGTLGSTVSGPSAALTGSESIPGVLGGTASSPSAAFSGGLAITGTFASTAPSPASSFSGLQIEPVTGTFASTAPHPYAALDGSVTQETIGVLASTAPSPFAEFSAPPYDWSLGVVSIASVVASVSVDTPPNGAVTIDDDPGTIILEPELAGVVS